MISLKSIHLERIGFLHLTPILLTAAFVCGVFVPLSSMEAAEQATNRSSHIGDSLASTLSSQPLLATNPTLARRESSLIGNEIEELEGIASDYARSVALRALLNRTEEEQILELLEQAKGINNPSRKLDTQTEIYRRFAVVDPIKALNHASYVSWRRRAPLIEAIFLEWALTDFEAALNKAATLTFSEQRVALRAILETRNDWSEDETIALAQKFGQTELAYQLMDESYLAQAIEDPAGAWNAITNDSRDDDLQYQSLAEILKLWSLRDGAKVLLDVQDILADLKTGEIIVCRPLRELASREPEASFELARSLHSNLRDEATECVMQNWAWDEPLAALQAISTIEPGILLNSLERMVASGWAHKDPRGLLSDLSSLPAEVQREAQLDAVSNIATKSPEEAAKLLNEIPNGIEEYGHFVALHWARKDVREALDWVLSMGESHQQKVLPWIYFELVEEDHELAFGLALSQPVSANRSAHEVRVIDLLAGIDLEEAISLLPRVRDVAGSKESAYGRVSKALIEQGESNRAIELGQELPESLREHYYLNLFSRWANWDMVDLFESLDGLPSTELKSEAAMQLLNYSEIIDGTTVHHYFSEQQIQEIRAYIAENESP